MAMLVRTLQIPTENASATTETTANAPQWLQPYLSAALRAGLLEQLPVEESSSYDWDQPMDRLEAAVMVQNALDLTVDSQMLETAAETWAASETDIPAWAKSSLPILAEHDVDLPASGELTRGDAAKLLYQTNRLSASAPGMMVIRMHQ